MELTSVFMFKLRRESVHQLARNWRVGSPDAPSERAHREPFAAALTDEPSTNLRGQSVVDAARRTLRRRRRVEHVPAETTVRRPCGFRRTVSLRPGGLRPEHDLAAIGAWLRPNQRVVVGRHILSPRLERCRRFVRRRPLRCLEHLPYHRLTRDMLRRDPTHRPCRKRAVRNSSGCASMSCRPGEPDLLVAVFAFGASLSAHRWLHGSPLATVRTSPFRTDGERCRIAVRRTPRVWGEYGFRAP
jgi:hypothetical protein